MQEREIRSFRCPQCGLAATEVEKELGTWVYGRPQRWLLHQVSCPSGCRIEADAVPTPGATAPPVSGDVPA